MNTNCITWRQLHRFVQDDCPQWIFSFWPTNLLRICRHTCGDRLIRWYGTVICLLAIAHYQMFDVQYISQGLIVC